MRPYPGGIQLLSTVTNEPQKTNDYSFILVS